MALTLKGSLSKPAQQLRRMVSLSEAFQRETGRTTAARAEDRVLLSEARMIETPRPFAVIFPGYQHGYQQVSGGARNWMRPFGQLGLYLTINTNPVYFDDQTLAEFDAGNFFGQVLDDVAELSAADDPGRGAGHLPITDIQLRVFGENDEQQHNANGRYYRAVYTVDWGFFG